MKTWMKKKVIDMEYINGYYCDECGDSFVEWDELMEHLEECP